MDGAFGRVKKGHDSLVVGFIDDMSHVLVSFWAVIGFELLKSCQPLLSRFSG